MKQFIQIHGKRHFKEAAALELDSEFKPESGVTFLDYWLEETEIIRLVMSILVDLGINELKLSGKEIGNKAPFWPRNWQNGKYVYPDDFDYLFRLCIKRHLWFRLYFKDIIFMSFDRDCCVRIGLNSNRSLLEKIKSLGQEHTEAIDITRWLEDEEVYYFGDYP
jgi:hypothetical protein